MRFRWRRNPVSLRHIAMTNMEILHPPIVAVTILVVMRRLQNMPIWPYRRMHTIPSSPKKTTTLSYGIQGCTRNSRTISEPYFKEGCCTLLFAGPGFIMNERIRSMSFRSVIAALNAVFCCSFPCDTCGKRWMFSATDSCC